MKLFTYGTLRKGFSNNYVLATTGAMFIEDDCVENFKMILIQTFPAAVKTDGVIQGEVFEISEECLQKCDWLEGYPKFYQREIVKTKNGHDAWIYYMPFIDNGDWKKFCEDQPQHCVFCGNETRKQHPCKGGCGQYICDECDAKGYNLCRECQFEGEEDREDEKEDFEKYDEPEVENEQF